MTTELLPSFIKVLTSGVISAGTIRVAQSDLSGIGLAQHRAPAHEFRRGPSSDLLIVAQHNITATSVEFDLGYGWREHCCFAPKPVYIVPADADARWRLDSESQCVFLSIADTEAQRLLRSFGIKEPGSCLWSLGSKGFAEELVHELVTRLWLEASAGSAPSPLLVSSYRTAIMHALARRQIASPPVHSVAKLTHRQLQSVLMRLHDLKGESLSIDELATIVGVTSWHFIRLFKASTGKTPYRYYEWVRMERAKTWLANGKLSIAVVATKLGFTGTSQFSRAFRQETGFTPTGYRRVRGE